MTREAVGGSEGEGALVAARLESFRARLAPGAGPEPRVTLFPVRHHSPACAWHLREWIREHRPASVVVEGPSSLSDLVPLLLDAGTRPPVAVYTHYVDRTRKLVAADPGDPLDGPGRYVAYYPFCVHSPEWVALREGREVGARLRFADLEYPAQLVDDLALGEGRGSGRYRVVSLLQERGLLRGRYVEELARRRGCRGPEELWDRLFENGPREDPEAFRLRLASYCFMGRVVEGEEAAAAEGHLRRERAMARGIREELVACEGPVLVVAGGFHLAGLLDCLELPAGKLKARRGEVLRAAARDVAQALVRYAEPQLDALGGYGAGMPGAGYRRRFWERLEQGQGLGEALASVCEEVYLEVGRRGESGEGWARTPGDRIAALEQARGLASLRGLAGPGLSELLDGATSAFVKQELEGPGDPVLRPLWKTLTGNAVGEVPDASGLPPLVDDFRSLARRHRLPLEPGEGRHLDLDLYRKEADRERSRFLHAVTSLGVPFGDRTGGPDFARGRGLHLLHEHWEVRWSPRTEAELVPVSVFGASVREAATNRLLEDLRELEAQGRGRRAGAAVALLLRALSMGLHDQLDNLVERARAHVEGDSSLPGLVQALRALVQLAVAWEPLGGAGLPRLEALGSLTYQRAVGAVRALVDAPSEQAEEAMAALVELHEVGAVRPDLDRDLLGSALEDLLAGRPGGVLGGASVGLLHQLGRLPETEVVSRLEGELQGTREDLEQQVGFARGLMAAARELLWSLPELLASLDGLVAEVEEEDFLRLLPGLRLAFSDLTPRQTDRVGEAVAQRHGRDRLQGLRLRGVDPELLGYHRGLEEELRAFLVEQEGEGPGAGADSRGGELS